MFVRRDRQKTLDTYAELLKAGVTVGSTNVPAQGAALAAAGLVANAITIEGPSTVVVGVAADFVAKQGGSQVVATWSTDPAGATADLGDPTSRTSVVAKQGGTFNLSAAVEGAPPPGTRTVTALPSAQARQLLPFLGAGWGSVVVAIVIVSVTGALGLVGALTGEGVATIIGALVGYVVVKGQSEGASGSSASGSVSSASGGGST